MVFLHLVMDGVQKYERIHRLQRPVLPCRNLRHDLLADLAHQLRRDVHIVQILDLLRDVTLAHPAGIQPQNFLLHAVRVPAVLADDLRLVFSVPIPGYLHIHRSKLGLHSLLRISVSVVSGLIFDTRIRHPLTFFVPQCCVQLTLHHLLQNIPKHFFHGVHDLCGAAEFLAVHVGLQHFLRRLLHNITSFQSSFFPAPILD